MRPSARSLVVALLASGMATAGDFYVLDNCAGRGRFTCSEQAALLKKIGIGGIGSTRPEELPTALTDFEASGV